MALRYETHIAPNIDLIKKLARENGQTEKQIAKQLHVAYSTFKEYKYQTNQACITRGIDTSALADALKWSREGLRLDIYESLYTMAKGGFKKRKVTYKNDKGYTVTDETLAPNTTCIAMALKILDPEAREALSNNVIIENKDYEENQTSLLENIKNAKDDKT